MQKSIKIVLLIFAIATCHVKAQNVTDSQRQNAVNTATRFCELLSQFSSGKGQYLSNDELIIKLCSSSKISTYDDIVEDREDILATYLINITHDYCNDLPMTFTKPVVESVFGLPELGLYYDGFIPQPEITGYSDTYLTMSCTQTIPKLNKSTNRKIIYSCKENKIISFSTNSSPFISYQKGLTALAHKDYESAIIFIEQALKAKRFDLQQSCCKVAVICSILLKDSDKILKYGSLVDDQSLATQYIGMSYLAKSDITNGLKYIEKSAQLGNESVYCILGEIYSVPESGFLNIPKAKEYFMKAINSADPDTQAVGAYSYSIMALNGPKEIQLERQQVIEYLKKAAENEYIMAYIPLAILYEEIDEIQKAADWAFASARNNNHVAMAMLGKYYISTSDQETINEGIKLLRLSIEFDSIDKELDAIAEQTGLQPKFPTSNEDVKQLLQKYNQ